MDEQIFLDWQLHFNLRRPNSRRATLIYAVATLWGQQIKVSTGVKVYAAHWDKDKQIARMSGGLSSLDSQNNAIVNIKIMEVAVQIERLKQYLCEHVELLTDEAKVKSLFVDYVNPTIKETMAAKKNTTPLRATAVFTKVMSEHWNYEKQGTRQKIATVREFCKWLEINGGDTLENVSKKTLALYERHLNTTPTTRSKIGAEYKTVKTKIGHIMSVIRKAKKFEDFPNDINVGVENYELQTKKLKDDDLSRSFAMTYEEVEQLYACQGLSDIDTEIKDLFVFQCEMGQRISTMLLWLKGEYREDNGFFDMISTKTSKEVSIPITARIREIQEKYKNGMKLMGKKKEATIVNIIDRNIKKIAEAAGLTRLYTYQSQIGDETYDETEPICDLMRSHIARHTFITQRLREGWTKDEIKIVTGHESDDMIDRVYAHLTKEDKKRQLVERINKVEETDKCSGTVNVGLGCSDTQILLNEVKRQAVDIHKKEQTIQKQAEHFRQLSDINAVVRQHDEYTTDRFQELVEYGSLSGFDDNEVDDDFDVDLSDRGLK